MNSPVQQVNIAIFSIEVDGVSIIFLLEFSTAQRAYPPGILDVLNSQNSPPFLTHEDPTCHHIPLHILVTTCFLLRVPKMPSVHRQNLRHIL